jgi:hypothetical protein
MRDDVAAVATDAAPVEPPGEAAMEERDGVRGRCPGVVEAHDVVDGDQFAAGGEAGGQGIGEGLDLVRRKVVGDLGDQDALPAAVGQVVGEPGLAEPDAGVVAEKAAGRGKGGLRAVDGVDAQRPRREGLRARAVAAGHVEGRPDERPAGQRAAALQRFEAGAAAAPRVVGQSELVLEAGEVDRAGQAGTSK